MKNPELPPEPQEELSPLRRYFSDVHYKRSSYFDMRVAAAKFVIAHNVTPDEVEADRIVDAVLPYYEYDKDITDLNLYDLMTTLPLLLVGEYVDTKMNLRDVRAWYDTTLTAIRQWTRPDHTAACLESPAFAFMPAVCAHGDHCPVITVAKYMDGPIFHSEEEMKGERYDADPIGMQEVVVMKQRLSLEHGYASATAVDERIAAYQKRFYSAHFVQDN